MKGGLCRFSCFWITVGDMVPRFPSLDTNRDRVPLVNDDQVLQSYPWFPSSAPCEKKSEVSAMSDHFHAELLLAGEAATENLGRQLGKSMVPGTFLDLRGDLGSGKTTFVRGLAEGMELASQVRSPTFVIATLHDGQTPLLHVDAYRLDQQEELALHGWNDYLESGVIAAEWAGRIEGMLPSERLQICFETVDQGHRRVQIEWVGANGSESPHYQRCMNLLGSL